MYERERYFINFPLSNADSSQHRPCVCMTIGIALVTVTIAKILPRQQNYNRDFNFNITFRIFLPHHLLWAVISSSL